MSETTTHAKLMAACLLAAYPALAAAVWQTVAVDQGKRVEINRDSIAPGQGTAMTAKGRVVLDRPIVDPKTSAAYRIIEIESRYDCMERTYATLRRTYFKEDDSVLRAEEVVNPTDMPVRSGTPDDRLLREACRPKAPATVTTGQSIGDLLAQINELAGGVRKSNEAMIEQATKREPRAAPRHVAVNASEAESYAAAPARPARPAERPAKTGGRDEADAGKPNKTTATATTPWSYDGATGPDTWGRLSPDYALCRDGRRQSPIDLGDGLAVDLAPIQFAYNAAAYRVVDGRQYLQVVVENGGFLLLGKTYRLQEMRLHAPSEFTVAGKSFTMEAQLIHRANDGQTAIVSVLLESGAENPVIQAALNNLPLERGGSVAPPGQSVDIGALLPGKRGYFTFMGSLTTPPCSEDVLWLVLQQAQQVSSEQLAIFQRLYRPNARPIQPAFGRIVKQSR